MVAQSQADRWEDRKQLESRVVEDDAFLEFLKSINGNVMRPVEPPTVEAEYEDITRQKPQDDEPPPRPIADE